MNNIVVSKKNNISILELSVFAAFFFTTITYIAVPLHMDYIYSLASKGLILVGTIPFIIYLMMSRFSRENQIQILIIIFMGLFSIISYIANSAGGLYDFSWKLMAYITLPMYFLYIQKIVAQRDILKFIFLLNIIVAVFFIWQSFYATSWEQVSGALYLGYSNSNRTGIFLFQNLSIIFPCYYYTKGKFKRTLILFIAIVVTVLIYFTQSRTALFTALLLWVLFFIKHEIRISKFTVIITLFLPFLFLYLAQILYENNLFTDVVILGKSIYSGRESMFSYILSVMKSHWFLGYYSEYQFANLHNGPLSIYAALGIIGLLLFYVFFIRVYISNITKANNNKVANLAYFGLLLLFFNGCTESALLVNGSMYAGAASVLIMLLQVNKENLCAMTDAKEEIVK